MLRRIVVPLAPCRSFRWFSGEIVKDKPEVPPKEIKKDEELQPHWVRYELNHSLTRSLTHSLTRSLTYLLAYLLAYLGGIQKDERSDDESDGEKESSDRPIATKKTSKPNSAADAAKMQ